MVTPDYRTPGTHANASGKLAGNHSHNVNSVPRPRRPGESTAGGQSAAETLVRLVERELGPLGRIRPLDAPPVRAPFRDGAAPAGFPGDRQPPVLRLAARAFGGALRRVGDRIYLDGVETDLPAVVAAARARGVAIRYPGIDPMEAALAGGPSIRPPRRRTGPLLADLRW